jgi:hypothetical protein
MTTHSSLANEALNWGQSPIISGPPDTGHPPSNLRSAVLASRSNSREAKKKSIATFTSLRFRSSHSKRATSRISNRNKIDDPTRIVVLSDQRESKDLSSPSDPIIPPLTTNHWTLLTEFLIDRPEIRIVPNPLKTNDKTNSNRPNSREMRESFEARRGREGGPWRAEALWGREGGHKYRILIGPGDD